MSEINLKNDVVSRLKSRLNTLRSMIIIKNNSTSDYVQREIKRAERLLVLFDTSDKVVITEERE